MNKYGYLALIGVRANTF